MFFNKFDVIKNVFILISIIYYSKVESHKVSAKFQKKDFFLEMKESVTNRLVLNDTFYESAAFFFTYQLDNEKTSYINETIAGKDIIEYIPNFIATENITKSYLINVTSISIGSIFIGVVSNSSEYINNTSVYFKVNVIYSHAIYIIGIVIGWIYFAAWTVSFYPQVVLNFYKKSVVGLNFDFLVFNWLGFFAYSCFNVALFWIEPIKEIYHHKNPRSVIPVQLNDVIFSLHALAIVTLQLIQCLFLERGKQKVSKFCILLSSLMVVYIIIILSIASADKSYFSWLDFFNYISYLKLFITLIKYIPQAYMNYKRKSTSGWSIGNVILDFTGGSLSILQMILIAYNNDDFKGFFTDPTKFGLGLFSIVFDVLFIIQHYCLYGNADDKTYEILQDDTDDDYTSSSGEILRIH